jgi:hypothetical protein
MTAFEPLPPGPVVNDVLCLSENTEKTFDFNACEELSCAAPHTLALDCGCTPNAAGVCSCAFDTSTLPSQCHIDVDCNIICAKLTGSWNLKQQCECDLSSGLATPVAPPSAGPSGSPLNGPTGVAANLGLNRLIVSNVSDGNLIDVAKATPAVIATIPTIPGAENYIAWGTGLNGWLSTDLYVTQGSTVSKVSFPGNVPGVPTVFATIPKCGPTTTGITFDHVGTFGFNMIVTCTTGNVYTIDPTGTVITFVATVPLPPHFSSTSKDRHPGAVLRAVRRADLGRRRQRHGLGDLERNASGRDRRLCCASGGKSHGHPEARMHLPHLLPRQRALLGVAGRQHGLRVAGERPQGAGWQRLGQ